MRIFALSLMLALASRAAAQGEPSGELAACVADHKLVQTTREAGRYLESRDAAARCAQASCPQLIREDCAAWYVDVAESTPSIVLIVRDRAGRDVAAPKVTLGERTLDVHGRAVALDPGRHELRVEASGFSLRVEPVLVRQGEKNRPVAITLEPIEQLRRAPPRTFSPAVIALGTVGVVGLSTFAALAIAGKVQRNQLDDCKPDCTRGEVDSVNRMYVAADVAAAIGGSAAIAATVLYILDHKRERRVEARGSSARTRSVDVALHPLGVRVQGAF